MKAIRQVIAVTGMNLQSLSQRLGSSLVIVVGIMGVVGVLVAALATANSLARTLQATGHADRAIVLRDDVEVEPQSTLTSSDIAIIGNAPGIARTPQGEAAVSAELVAAVDLPQRKDGERGSVMVRSLSAQGLAVRSELKIIEGRLFTPGLHEITVGRRVQTQFKGLAVGESIALGNGTWKVVGVHASGNGLDSTILADTSTLMSAFQRTVVNSVTVLLEPSPQAFKSFKDALTSDPSLAVTVMQEREYFERRSSEIVQQILVITYIVCAIMAIGALFAALNTMHSAVSVRAVEIATLRAFGFGAGSIVVSVLIEAQMLAVVGALLGAGIVWLVMNGDTVSLGGSSGSLMAEMRVTSDVLTTGVLWACVTGFIGGMFPAIRAARVPIVTGLRSS